MLHEDGGVTDWRIRRVRVAMAELVREQAHTPVVAMDWFTGQRYPTTVSDLLWLKKHADAVAIAASELAAEAKQALREAYEAEGLLALVEDLDAGCF